MMRVALVFASTIFTVVFIMLMFNVITIDQIAAILKLSPEVANVLKLIISRLQEVSLNIIHMVNQMLNKLFAGSGIDMNQVESHAVKAVGDIKGSVAPVVNQIVDPAASSAANPTVNPANK